MTYVAESTYGTTPASPVMKTLRHNATTLALSKGDLVPAETREDGQINYAAHGNWIVGGTVECELVYGDLDDWLAAVMRGAWVTNTLKSGILNPSFSVERRFTDITQYMLFKGVVVDSLELGIQQSADGMFATCTFTVLGQTMIAGGTQAGAPVLPVEADPPFVSFKGSLLEGGVANAVVTGVTFSIANNYGPRNVVGSPLTVDPSRRRMEVTGTVTAFFETRTMLDRFINETETTMELTMNDTPGNGLKITVPRLKYTGGDIPRTQDDDILITMPFRCLYDNTAASPLVWLRIPGP
jgi:hypothetical protein